MRSEITIEMTINGQGVRISEVGVHRRADSCKGYFWTGIGTKPDAFFDPNDQFTTAVVY